MRPGRHNLLLETEDPKVIRVTVERSVIEETRAEMAGLENGAAAMSED